MLLLLDNTIDNTRRIGNRILEVTNAETSSENSDKPHQPQQSHGEPQHNYGSWHCFGCGL